MTLIPGVRATAVAGAALSVCSWLVLAASSAGADSAPEPPPGAAVAAGDDGPMDEGSLETNAALDRVLRYARENNPGIRAAEQAWLADLQRITRERSYENPWITFVPDTGALSETRSGRQSHGVELSQAIPFPGKLTLKGRVADSRARATQQRLEAVIQEILRQTRSRYADYFLGARSLRINAETMRLARQFADIAAAKYRVAGAAQQDVIQSQEKISELAAERVIFESEFETALGALNSLLDRQPRAPLGPPSDLSAGELAVPLAELVEAADSRRPELLGQDNRVQAGRDSVRLARMGYLPDFKIGAQYVAVQGGTNPLFSRDGNDVWRVKLGFSIPIWIDRVGAEVSEARARLARERARRRDLANLVHDEVQRSYERVRAASRTERIYRTTLIPQTQERVAAARAGYQTGVVDFLTLIDSLEALERVQLERDRAVRAYHAGVADLERATGSQLQGVAP
ncbi:MAG: TolC family protein [Myxococcota bacterium]